ncbi:MAG: winged helix-turn-helix transcriptional regulator [Clostridia bacterium]|nr:winged helix-turn-helix transcriptional regulator [Clostridia bacterium]MBR5753626.1 winged helix-turn-helix transcriptional regulator [Clostridia bacterium]
MKYQAEYMAIYEDFKANSKFFQAIGNETRQGILLFLIQSGEKGARVSEITENAHLSRPAVSHHLNVLKDAGIIHCRPEGTSHYYYINIREQLPHLLKMNQDVGAFFKTYYKDDPEELAKLKAIGIPID